ncbi:hypothetical protein MMC28_000952 [Mycoblastus sanguinarius]|nr:hypothetical protein [Mycoblastus sanguinarius]
MVSPGNQSNDMGITSSQLQDQPVDKSTMEEPRRSKIKKGKSKKKSKKRSAELEDPVDQEQESARALIKLSGATLDDSRGPYYHEDLAASQQLMDDSSPTRPRDASNTDDPITGTLQKSHSRSKGDKKAKRKRKQDDDLAFRSSEEFLNGQDNPPGFPSTPPAQTDYEEPLDYRPTISQSSHQLDDIPTDDEEVAAYMQEYEHGTAGADPPTLPNDDIYSFSQQPPDASDQEDPQAATYSIYQPPTHVHTSPNTQEQRTKKRKRRTASILEDTENGQSRVAHEEGQNTLNTDLVGAFDKFFEENVNLANMFGDHEGHNMPIDPILHSMNALPPSADLSNLNGEDDQAMQNSDRAQRKAGSSRQSKRRRLEESQNGKAEGAPYFSPYALHPNQGNPQDRVLPGVEQLRHYGSPEFGSPFIDTLRQEDTEMTFNEPQPSKPPSRKKQGAVTKVNGNKTQNRDQKSESSKRPVKEISEKGGPFSSDEVSKLDKFRETYCGANDMPVRQFNDLIQQGMRGNAPTTALFNEVHEVLPYRPRMSVQKFCRRHFHNFSARGTWTPEEDEMLKQAVAEKGNSWKAVGEMIDRMPEDCRDRYRNYLVNSEYRNREQWTDAEVRNLAMAILECMQLMKDERRQKREAERGRSIAESESESDQAVEDMKLINWQTVSSRMGEHGGSRSRLQCSIKWNQVKAQDRNNILKAAKEAGDFESRKPDPNHKAWRMRRALKKVANMRSGDQYIFLLAVLNCGAPVEGNIPWKSLGDEGFRATWNATDKKAAWSKMKSSIPGSEFMDYRNVVHLLLTQTLSQDPHALDERWDPEVDGDVNETELKRQRKAERLEKKSDRKGKQREKTHVKKDRKENRSKKSSAIVQNSDEEDNLYAGNGRLDGSSCLVDNEMHDYNRFDAFATPSGAQRERNADGEDASNTADEREQLVENGNAGRADVLFYPEEVSVDLADRMQVLRDV